MGASKRKSISTKVYPDLSVPVTPDDMYALTLVSNIEGVLSVLRQTTAEHTYRGRKIAQIIELCEEIAASYSGYMEGEHIELAKTFLEDMEKAVNRYVKLCRSSNRPLVARDRLGRWCKVGE